MDVKDAVRQAAGQCLARLMDLPDTDLLCLAMAKLLGPQRPPRVRARVLAHLLDAHARLAGSSALGPGAQSLLGRVASQLAERHAELRHPAAKLLARWAARPDARHLLMDLARGTGDAAAKRALLEALGTDADLAEEVQNAHSRSLADHNRGASGAVRVDAASAGRAACASKPCQEARTSPHVCVQGADDFPQERAPAEAPRVSEGTEASAAHVPATSADASDRDAVKQTASPIGDHNLSIVQRDGSPDQALSGSEPDQAMPGPSPSIPFANEPPLLTRLLNGLDCAATDTSQRRHAVVEAEHLLPSLHGR